MDSDSFVSFRFFFCFFFFNDTATTEIYTLSLHDALPISAIAMPARDSASAVQGILSFVDNQVDTATGSVLLKARFPNRDGALWPGEFVSITLVLGVQTDAVVVPSQAVMQGQQGTYVFVVNSDGTAATQPVTVERTLDSLSVIAGVPAGDRGPPRSRPRSRNSSRRSRDSTR